jgi:hypothetical protein
MSAKTMLDMGGLAFLDGDPLGLRELEESLAWQANGPLPQWLDGADPDNEDNVHTHRISTAKAATRPAADHEVPSATAAALSLKSTLSVHLPPANVTVPDVNLPAESADVESAACVTFDDSPAESSAPSARRDVARLALVASAAGRLWAIPLERVARVAPHQDGQKAIDLSERLDGKKRSQPGLAIVLDDKTTIVVDHILGPRTLQWRPRLNDGPKWALAHAIVDGEAVGLLDCDGLGSTTSGNDPVGG